MRQRWPSCLSVADSSHDTLRGAAAGDVTEPFTVRAFSTSQEEALWIFTRKDSQVLNFALALATGMFGEIYAGGFGANGYPAVAYIAS